MWQPLYCIGNVMLCPSYVNISDRQKYQRAFLHYFVFNTSKVEGLLENFLKLASKNKTLNMLPIPLFFVWIILTSLLSTCMLYRNRQRPANGTIRQMDRDLFLALSHRHENTWWTSRRHWWRQVHNILIEFRLSETSRLYPAWTWMVRMTDGYIVILLQIHKYCTALVLIHLIVQIQECLPGCLHQHPLQQTLGCTKNMFIILMFLIMLMFTRISSNSNQEINW